MRGAHVFSSRSKPGRHRDDDFSDTRPLRRHRAVCGHTAHVAVTLDGHAGVRPYDSRVAGRESDTRRTQLQSTTCAQGVN